jgi:hypothetical protein
MCEKALSLSHTHTHKHINAHTHTLKENAMKGIIAHGLGFRVWGLGYRRDSHENKGHHYHGAQRD